MFKRTTLVVASRRRPSWNPDCVLFVDSLFGLHAGFAMRDVERVILDRSASAQEYSLGPETNRLTASHADQVVAA